MKTHIIAVVAEDSMDSEALYDAVDAAIPCSCRAKVPGDCNMHVMSMSTVKHTEDEWVDVSHTIVNEGDEE